VSSKTAVLPALVFLGVVSTAVGSLGAPLLPTIARIDHVSLAASQWALTISLLAGAVASPVLGRLGDGHRRRTVIITALAIVAVGCGIAALPLGFGWLLVGRAMQGVGLGLVPLAIAAARDALPAEKSGPGIALLGVTTAAGLGIGYPIAGVITQFLGLSAAFVAGALITVIAAVGVAVFVPASPRRQRRSLDVLGAVLLAIAISGLLLVCAEGPEWGWASVAIILTGAGAIVAAVSWVLWELRTSSPLVNVRLLRHPSVLAADVMVVLVGAGIYPLLSLVVRYVQTPASLGYGYGYPAAIAGLMLVPYSFASFAASRVVNRLIKKLSLELLVAISSAILIAAMVVFLTGRTNLVLLLLAMALAGCGIGAIFAINPAQLHAGVPAHETGSANSFYQVLRYIGYSLGSALSATLLVTSIPAGTATPTENGYSAAAWFGIGALVVALIAAMLLSRHSGHASESGDTTSQVPKSISPAASGSASRIGWGVSAARRLPAPRPREHRSLRQ
jgi:predicted MFS family arabinose efflux permease